MRETSHTCCVTAFGKYSTELEEIRACYERNKVTATVEYRYSQHIIGIIHVIMFVV